MLEKKAWHEPELQSQIFDDRFRNAVFGRKGHGLITLHKELELSVPPFRILTTGFWEKYNRSGITEGLERLIDKQIDQLNNQDQGKFGDPEDPLFVSVRSGAAVSMPGIMSTILNVGLNDQTVEKLAERIGEMDAWISYYNLIIKFATYFFGIDSWEFIVDEVGPGLYFLDKQDSKIKLSVGEIKEFVSSAKGLITTHGFKFPQDVKEQLKMAVRGVFDSWNTEEAKRYRKTHEISKDLGTAVVIQSMVFGNSDKDNNAGSGVMLINGKSPTIGFIHQAQGEAVVGEQQHGNINLDQFSPEIQEQLARIFAAVSEKYKKPMEVEFTIDQTGKVWALQLRELPPTVLDEFKEIYGLIDKKFIIEVEGAVHFSEAQLRSLTQPGLDKQAVSQAVAEGRLIAKNGVKITGGHAYGKIIHSLDEVSGFESDEPLILVTHFENKTADLLLADALPKNIVGVVADNGGIGSHIGRHLELRSRDQPMTVVFNLNLKDISSGTLVTLDGDNTQAFRGTIDKSPSETVQELDPGQIAMIQQMIQLRRENPWFFLWLLVYHELESIWDKVEQTTQEIDRLGITSMKAKETLLCQNVLPFPSEKCWVVKPDDQGTVKQMIREILQRGNDASVRTCHDPPLATGGPWALITNKEQLELLFSEQKYKAYGHSEKQFPPLKELVKDIDKHRLTELLVSEIPKGKLDPDPQIKRQHCAWTLSCNSDGEVILQVAPFFSDMRTHGATTGDDMVTLVIKHNMYWSERRSSLTSRTIVGKNIEDSEEAEKLYNYVFLSIVKKLFEIIDTLALLSYKLGSVVTVEGQARLGDRSWCQILEIRAN